jgi:hypothetical protein
MILLFEYSYALVDDRNVIDDMGLEESKRNNQ